MGNKVKFEFRISELNSKPTARKKTKAAEVKTDTGFLEAFDALPDELRADQFISAYVSTRSIKRTQRSIAKQKREEAQAVINKIKKMEKKAADKGELVYAIRNKDFVFNYWELPNGQIFKEVIARQGLMLVK